MKQIQYARKKRRLKYLSKKLLNLLNEKREGTARQVEILVLKIKNLVQELMFVYSRADLKKVLGAAAVLIGISFSGQLSAQSFAPVVTNPFNLDSTYYISNPAFADLDGDGDMDLLAGELEGAIKYFENIGSAVDPQFAAPLTNPFGLDSSTYLAFPTFSDLDDDGDFDLLVGEMYGAMRYFENTGSATSPAFAPAQTNPFNLTSTYYWASPAFVDMDNDGDMDVLAGEYYGNMKYYENIGSVSSPNFAPPLTNPFGLTQTYLGAFPTFTDLDMDGDVDLLAGEPYGALKYYENTVITDVPTNSKEFDILLFPNPAKDMLYLKTGEKITQIEIFNTSGQSFGVQKEVTNKVSLHHLTPGLYFVKITNLDGIHIVKQIYKQ